MPDEPNLAAGSTGGGARSTRPRGNAGTWATGGLQFDTAGLKAFRAELKETAKMAVLLFKPFHELDKLLPKVQKFYDTVARGQKGIGLPSGTIGATGFGSMSQNFAGRGSTNLPSAQQTVPGWFKENWPENQQPQRMRGEGGFLRNAWATEKTSFSMPSMLPSSVGGISGGPMMMGALAIGGAAQKYARSQRDSTMLQDLAEQQLQQSSAYGISRGRIRGFLQSQSGWSNTEDMFTSANIINTQIGRSYGTANWSLAYKQSMATVRLTPGMSAPAATDYTTGIYTNQALNRSLLGAGLPTFQRRGGGLNPLTDTYQGILDRYLGPDWKTGGGRGRRVAAERIQEAFAPGMGTAEYLAQQGGPELPSQIKRYALNQISGKKSDLEDSLFRSQEHRQEAEDKLTQNLNEEMIPTMKKIDEVFTAILKPLEWFQKNFPEVNAIVGKFIPLIGVVSTALGVKFLWSIYAASKALTTLATSATLAGGGNAAGGAGAAAGAGKVGAKAAGPRWAGGAGKGAAAVGAGAASAAGLGPGILIAGSIYGQQNQQEVTTKATKEGVLPSWSDVGEAFSDAAGFLDPADLLGDSPAPRYGKGMGDASIDFLMGRRREGALTGEWLNNSNAPTDPSFTVLGLNPELRRRLVKMFEDNPALGINTGYRDDTGQQALFDEALVQYGSYEEAAKHIAPPGQGSPHQRGIAVDLGPPDQHPWLAQHAAQYGLAGPLYGEAWHFELDTAQGGATGPSETQPAAVTGGAGGGAKMNDKTTAATKKTGSSGGSSKSGNRYGSVSLASRVNALNAGVVMPPGGGGAISSAAKKGGAADKGAVGPDGKPAAAVPGGGPSTYTGSMDMDDYYRAVLAGIGAPATEENLKFMRAWKQAEGGDTTNPFNTTQDAEGATSINSVGVKRYPNPQIGQQATIQTLTNGMYDVLLAALRQGSNAMADAQAEAQTPWGTGELIMSVLQGQGDAGIRMSPTAGGSKGMLNSRVRSLLKGTTASNARAMGDAPANGVSSSTLISGGNFRMGSGAVSVGPVSLTIRIEKASEQEAERFAALVMSKIDEQVNIAALGTGTG